MSVSVVEAMADAARPTEEPLASSRNGVPSVRDSDQGKHAPQMTAGNATGTGSTVLRFQDVNPAVATQPDSETSSTLAVAPEVPIYEIQGNTQSSPYLGQEVTTTGIVTAIASDGFFLQTPDAQVDGDETTSEGIFVRTGAPPEFTEGDAVSVTAIVNEYYGLTELSSSPEVAVLSTGNPQPSPVVFDATTPPSTFGDPHGTEAFECMLVKVTGGTVSGPTSRYGEFFAVAPGRPRAQREPGIEAPGLPGLPVWDGNPEVFSVDPDFLGLLDRQISAGATFDASGPLTFSYGEYLLAPKSLVVTDDFQERPVRQLNPGEFTVATLNTENLGAGEFDRFEKLSLLIRNVIRSPDVLFLQEFQDLITLLRLASQIVFDDPSIVYTAQWMDSPLALTQQVGFLVRDTMTVTGLSQFGLAETFDWEGSVLSVYHRVPLILEGLYNGVDQDYQVTVIGIHLRSFVDIDTSDFARQKRFEQSTRLSQEIQTRQVADPNLPIIVVGDFHAFEFTDGYVDVVGQISGVIDPNNSLLPGTDEVNPDLTNQILNLSSEERYSHVDGGSSMALDHVLTTANMAQDVSGVAFGRVNADVTDEGDDWLDPGTPRRSSDHDPLVLFVRGEENAFQIFQDGFESGDTSAWVGTP